MHPAIASCFPRHLARSTQSSSVSVTDSAYTPSHFKSTHFGVCRVIYLEDNDIVHMKGGEYTVYNWNDVDSPSVEVRRTVQTLTMEVSQIMKVREAAHAAVCISVPKIWLLSPWLCHSLHACCIQKPHRLTAACCWRAGWLQLLHGEGDL